MHSRRTPLGRLSDMLYGLLWEARFWEMHVEFGLRMGQQNEYIYIQMQIRQPPAFTGES